MSQTFLPGDFLIFQFETAYGLLRLLEIDGEGDDAVYHLAAYENMFLDIDSAESAIATGNTFTVSAPHLALTKRAFESTQTARLDNRLLEDRELATLYSWRKDAEREVSDLSVRLLLGMR
ncbi:MAG: hypothetical protein ACK5NT_15925 [Pyrinomonadaceae bacterium]